MLLLQNKYFTGQSLVKMKKAFFFQTPLVQFHVMQKTTICKTSDSVIIWHPDVIHKCPFEYVQSGSFIYEDNLLIDRNQSILFQVINTETACDIEMLVTSEGLYLTNNTKALKLPNANSDVKLINDFMLAETDFNKEQQYIQLLNMLQKSNIKICYLYLKFFQDLTNFSQSLLLTFTAMKLYYIASKTPFLYLHVYSYPI